MARSGATANPDAPHGASVRDDREEVPIELEEAPRDTHASDWVALEWEEDPTHHRSGPMTRLFSGRFGRWLLPAIIAQSILIGGGYATGREVVEYGARFGALAWVAVLTIFVGFSLVSILVYEFARITRAYDYKSFIRGLIGPAWPLFDLVYVGMGILVIAVIASATGDIMQTTLGIPKLVGILLVVAVVALLAYHGSRLIETFKTFGTTALYIGYAVFALVVLLAAGGNVQEVLRSGDTSYADGATIAAVVGSGILYIGFNLSIYPAVLFSLHRQGKTRDSVIAGIASGLIMTVPFLLTTLAVLAHYPDEAVLGANVPWLGMLGQSAGTWVIVVFGIVMGWTLMETSVGFIHAVLERVERDLAASTRIRRDHLSGLQKGAFGATVLLAAVLLSLIGIVDLVAFGYRYMAYGFLVLFALPLATVGVWKMVQARRGPTPAAGAVTVGRPSAR